jgi:hypothetical protein
VEAVICEPVSGIASSLFRGKIQGNRLILVEETGPTPIFSPVDQQVGAKFPRHKSREFLLKNREIFMPNREPYAATARATDPRYVSALRGKADIIQHAA